MTSFELLQSLCQRGETGMLFAVTKDGHQLRVGFLNGAIVHVAYALRAGAEALRRARRATAVSSNFSRGIVSGRDADLPDREVLMEFFAPILANGSVTPALEREMAIAARDQPAAVGQTQAVHFTPHEQLRRLALDYLGPMGSMLLDEALAGGVPSWATLVDRLASNLPMPAADSFREAARRINE